MKEIAVEQAVGTVLAHDLTQIIPGEYKGAKFKKGHVIREEDIEILLSMGKKHLYVVEKDDTERRLCRHFCRGCNHHLVENLSGSSGYL